MFFEEISLCENLFSSFTYGLGQYYARNFADIFTLAKEFRLFESDRVIPAFRWKNGRIFALAVNGDIDLNIEYLYLHIQKRVM